MVWTLLLEGDDREKATRRGVLFDLCSNSWWAVVHAAYEPKAQLLTRMERVGLMNEVEKIAQIRACSRVYNGLEPGRQGYYASHSLLSWRREDLSRRF
jgi:hypothetical protein